MAQGLCSGLEAAPSSLWMNDMSLRKPPKLSVAYGMFSVTAPPETQPKSFNIVMRNSRLLFCSRPPPLQTPDLQLPDHPASVQNQTLNPEPLNSPGPKNKKTETSERPAVQRQLLTVEGQDLGAQLRSHEGPGQSRLKVFRLLAFFSASSLG